MDDKTHYNQPKMRKGFADPLAHLWGATLIKIGK
jgi:hypothetical protein